MSRAGEFDWIARHFAPLSAAGSFGLKDDAAHLHERPDVVTKDMLVEGVHFLHSDPPQNIAIKALRVNISDCVAKGARPIGALVGLGIPDRWEDDEVADFASGLAKAGLGKTMPLIGGDTTRSPDKLVVSVTVLGALDGGPYISRLGARAGDILCVNGPIGDAALGLMVARGSVGAASWLNAYQEPPDQTGFERIVSEFATAAMDLSDGFLGDCGKLAAASRLSARIERAKVPVSRDTAARLERHPDDWQRVLNGGDDYVILMSVTGERLEAALDAASRAGWALTAVGQLVEECEPRIALFNNGVALSASVTPYTHR